MFIGRWGNGFRRFGLWGGLLLGVLATPAVAQRAEDGFHPDFDGAVRAVDVNVFDNKVIAVGEFASVDGQARSRVVRLNTDGSVDSGFVAPVVGGEVFAAASYYDGRVAIAGRFDTVGGVPRTGIARLNADGSLDSGFAPLLSASTTPDGVPVGLALHVTRGEELLLGGWFGSVAGKTHKGIVRFSPDGSVDDGFNASVDDAARGFTELRSNQLVIHGNFEVVNGEPRTGIAKLDHDGGLVETFAPAPDSHVAGVALQADDKLVVSGSFEHIAGAARHGIARISVHGELDASYSPDRSLFGDEGVGPVVLQRDGKLWVATRSCPTLGADRCDSLVRLNPDGSADATARLEANQWIVGLAMQGDGKLVFGGSFTSVGTASHHHLARLNRDGSLDETTRTYANGSVRAMATLADGGLILGGEFSSINQQSRSALAKLHPDGSLDADFHPNLGSPVGPGKVHAVSLLPDGRMIIAGDLTMVNGGLVTNIARLHADGSLDTSFVGWIGGNNPYVSALLPLPDGGMLLGGKFDLVNGVARANLAKLDADGNLDTGFVDAAVGTVTALARQSDGSILVGVAMMSSDYRHLVRLNPDGSWDTGWLAEAAHVAAIVLQPDGKILVAGSNDMVLPWAPTIQRLNTDGSRDTSFEVNVNGVETMLLRPDGSLILGGAFTVVNGQTRNHVCRVDRNGVLDPGFDPNALGGAVHALAMQVDGKLALGGEFTLLDGQTRYYFGRLSAPELRTQDFQFVPYAASGSVLNWSGMPHAGIDLEAPPMLLARPEGDAGFSEVGAMQRTVDGWAYLGYMPPFDRNVDLRVQARPRSGQANGSSGLLESTLRVYVSAESNPDYVFADGFE